VGVRKHRHIPTVAIRPRSSNANPNADEAILGNLKKAGREVRWAITPDKIGFIAVSGWTDSDTSSQVEEVLEQMRDTRGLVLDVRLNGGGSEPLAREVAGRFLEKEFVYAYSQYRNGPKHMDLTEKGQIRREPQSVSP
jgi:C-terminal processing protease CtpA/Prc